VDLNQLQGESLQTYILRLKSEAVGADEGVRDAQALQEHCIAAYRKALQADVPKAVLREASDAVLRAGAQMARARKRRDDVEYALFEALQLWDV
jgi:hypothetical protein